LPAAGGIFADVRKRPWHVGFALGEDRRPPGSRSGGRCCTATIARLQ